MNEHPAVAQLRVAVVKALQAREKALAALHKHDQKRHHARVSGKRWEPDYLGPYWGDFARDGYTLSTYGGLRVSPEGAETALVLLQSLCNAAPAHRWHVAPKPAQGALSLRDDALTCTITTRERFSASELVVSTKFSHVQQPSKAGTGTFILVIAGLGRTDLLVEGSPAQITDQANSGALFERIAQRAKNARHYQAIEDARREERERQEADARRLRIEENQRIAAIAAELERQRAVEVAEIEKQKSLLAEATAWRDATLIRQYVRHAQATGKDEQWAAWALQVADRLDPRSSAPELRPSPAPDRV